MPKKNFVENLIIFFVLVSPFFSLLAKEKKTNYTQLPNMPVSYSLVDGSRKIDTYVYPEIIYETPTLGYLKRSSYYDVSVSNEEGDFDVYVMEDRNAYQTSHPEQGNGRIMSERNHTASFSFEGTVKVKIKNLKKNIANVKIFPRQKDYSYVINDDCLEINLSKWAYIYVAFEGMDKDPLFIFADELESIPDKDKCTVLTPQMSASELKNIILDSRKHTFYFEPGVYDFDQHKRTDESYEGYQIPLLSDKTYYVPGGTVIIGSLSSALNEDKNNQNDDYGELNNCIVRGRGVITGCGKERLSGKKAIPYSLFYAGPGEGCLIDGIQFNNPPHFNILSRGSLTTRRTKIFGWYHQTDGWGAGERSLLEESFIKVNDDNAKVYRDYTTLRDLILYKQINGAGIQLGWGNYGQASHCLIEDIYVVADTNKGNQLPPTNTGVINLRWNDGSTIEYIKFKNIFLECRVQRFLGLDNRSKKQSDPSKVGKINHLILENVFFEDEMYNHENYLIARGGSKYNDIIIRNMLFKGQKVISDLDWKLKQYKGISTKDENKLEPFTLLPIIYQ